MAVKPADQLTVAITVFLLVMIGVGLQFGRKFIAPIFIPLFFTMLARTPKPKEVEEAQREHEAAEHAMHPDAAHPLEEGGTRA